MKTILKALCAILIVGVLVVGGGAALSYLDIDNPLSDATEGAQVAATNAAIDASGIKGKAQNALESNREKIASATGLPVEKVDEAIDAIDIESWQATALPEDAQETGTTSVNYDGVSGTITTYDDPSVVTVEAYGQEVTLAVPSTAQGYLGYLSYLDYVG